MIPCYFDTGLVLKLVVKEPLSWGRLFFDTIRMISGATVSTGCRTLDLLHIATTRQCDASEFVTGDARQVKAARFCGLNVVEIR